MMRLPNELELFTESDSDEGGGFNPWIQVIRIIAIPGQYSGDMWHIAGAMIVDSSVHARITIASESDDDGVAVMLKFFKSIGLEERVSVVKGKAGKTVELGAKTREIAELPAKKIAWQSVSIVQAQKHQGTVLVHPVYRSTAFIMHAMEEHGKHPVLLALRAGFTSKLSMDVCSHVAFEARKLLEGLKSKKVLFVLGRIAGYNPQHDLTKERLKLIAETAGTCGYDLVIVGPEHQVNQLVNLAGCKDRVAQVVDLRHWRWLTGKLDPDERARAYFWRCIVDIAHRLGVEIKLVGGRSGSTDLAAFMGVECLCWDECDLSNPEYIRLLMTAPSLMYVTHTVILQQQRWPLIQTEHMLGRDLGLFLLDKLVGAPAISFAFSQNAKKKKTDGEALAKRPLQDLAFYCTICLFDIGRAPRAFAKLHDLLKKDENEGGFWVLNPSEVVCYLPEDGGTLLTLAQSIPPLTLDVLKNLLL